MAITELYSGSASISTTEYSLTNSSTTLQSKTDDGVFQLVVDVDAMAAGDQYLFKILEKARSADTQRIVWQKWLTGDQGGELFVSPSLVLMHGWEMTATRLTGTDRTLNWSIRQVA